MLDPLLERWYVLKNDSEFVLQILLFHCYSFGIGGNLQVHENVLQLKSLGVKEGGWSEILMALNTF